MVLDIRFGPDGNDQPFLGQGWFGNTPGFRWMGGGRTTLTLDYEQPAPFHILAVEVRPFLPQNLVSQRLRICVNDCESFQGEIDKPGPIGFLIPSGALAGAGRLRVTFDHPGAVAPEAAVGTPRTRAFQMRHLSLVPIHGAVPPAPTLDTAPVAVADLQSLTGQSAENFLSRFESLGNNCEFGLVQRRGGAEPLSLLRFASCPLPFLLPAMREGFGRIGMAENLRCRFNDAVPPEFIVHDDTYRLVYHTDQFDGETDAERILAAQPARLRFLARKLMEDLQAGEKIFVIRRNPPLPLAQVLAAFAAVRRLGPGRLLWIDLARDGKEVGTVQEILPGLYRGFLDRLPPDLNVPDLSLQVWLRVLVNTWLLGMVSEERSGTCRPPDPKSFTGPRLSK